jgi:hypothetical protein
VATDWPLAALRPPVRTLVMPSIFRNPSRAELPLSGFFVLFQPQEAALC